MAVAMSEEEIEREVRTLKNLRRRSTTSSGPGELPVDPDLPPREAFEHHTGQSYSSNDDVTLSLDGDAGLFWVPAHLHPELAPGEFRQFLKHHTQVDPSGVESGEAGEASLARSPSWLARSRSMSGSLNRKKSMLSKQYTPRVGDMIEDEGVPSLRRGSQGFGDTGMTLRDLQRLEEMVDDDNFEDDPEKMRQLLRRSMSGKRPGSVEEEREGDTPLVAPRPGSIIRRTARTRIRKGDTKNRRFSSSARKPRAGEDGAGSGSVESEEGARRSDERRSDERRSDETSDERTSYETAEAQPSSEMPRIETSQADEDEDEALIFDAYARDRTSTSTTSSYADDSRPASPPPEERPVLHPILTPSVEERWYEDDEVTPTRETGDMSAALHAMTLLPEDGSGSGEIFPAERAPAEPVQQTAAPVAPTYELPPGMAPPLHTTSVPSMSQNRTNGPVPPALAIDRPPLARTDSNNSSVSSSSVNVAPLPPATKHPKEKKSGLFGKKHSKDKEKEKTKKEKDGFLGSLFGSKKKTEESSSVANFATQGPAAAAALLGTSKSAKSLHAGSGTSSPTSPGFSNFARYPIHVERAVYRLSHIKLANARRPLIEQVLISNLMFWYLGIIGRAAGPAEDAKPGTVNGLDEDRDETARNPPAKGTPPKPSEGGALKRAKPVQPPPAVVTPVIPVHEHHVVNNVSPVSQRKTGLVKPERSRASNNSEAPLRTPQYGIQNAQVDKEMRHVPKQEPQHQPQHAPQHHVNHHTPQTGQYAQQHPQQHAQHQQQHMQQGQHQQHQPAAANPNRTSSVGPGPNRTRSPPTPAMSAPRSPEYPPGVAPPRPQSFGSGGRPLPPSNEPQRQRVHSLPPGPQPLRPGQPNMLPAQQQAYPRNGERPYPHGNTAPPHGGAQPGQIFQYPGQRSQYSGPQPGQIFHHPQFQQRPPQQQPQPQPQQQWASGTGTPQRGPGPGPGPGHVPANLANVPPRRTSSNPQDYSRPQQTSPTHQSFYAHQYPNGARPAPLPAGHYPHHR